MGEDKTALERRSRPKLSPGGVSAPLADQERLVLPGQGIERVEKRVEMEGRLGCAGGERQMVSYLQSSQVT